MYCPHCGKELADDASLCAYCGAKIPDAATRNGQEEEPSGKGPDTDPRREADKGPPPQQGWEAEPGPPPEEKAEAEREPAGASAFLEHEDAELIAPEYKGPPAAPEPQGTNWQAIAALVCAIFIPPLGLILGILVVAELDRDGRTAGRRVAVAAIVIATLIMSLFLLVGMVSIVLATGEIAWS
ncbi:MAG: zinc-ribbon domain-containing protein [Armatimonadota bacterium]